MRPLVGGLGDGARFRGRVKSVSKYSEMTEKDNDERESGELAYVEDKKDRGRACEGAGAAAGHGAQDGPNGVKAAGCKAESTASRNRRIEVRSGGNRLEMHPFAIRDGVVSRAGSC